MSEEITLKQLIELILEQAKEKDWGTKPGEVNLAAKMALAHSELSEALNAYRHHNINGEHGFNEEIADAVIRILHICCIYGIDIEKEVLKKIEFNKQKDWKWDKLSDTK